MNKIHRPDVPKKEDLKRLYDICNEIFKKKECFYTEEEVKKLKANKENRFI
jgi:hypothetical protein